jgi:hypothetical protein
MVDPFAHVADSTAAWLDYFLFWKEFERKTVQFLKCRGLFASVVMFAHHQSLDLRLGW